MWSKSVILTDNQVVALITAGHYIISRWKQTHIPTHRQHSAADTHTHTHVLKKYNHTHSHRQHRVPHTHSSEIWGPFWQPPSWLGIGSDQTDPRKAKQTHESAGAFVFVECHTSSRGKPITGPGRALKLWEECVGIASVATSDVNSNILIAG